MLWAWLGSDDQPEGCYRIDKHTYLAVADGKVRTHILPFDQESLPVGGVQFLNLTTRHMRCSIDTECRR